MADKEYILKAGPFHFSVKSNVSSIQRYVEHHYGKNLVISDTNLFIDYYVSVEHGPFYRRLFKPQVKFRFSGMVPFKPLPLDQAHAMLEWGMNWVISTNANQYLIIHAASLEKDGKGIIITAASGSGKSTLCAYLVSRGWRLLSDELALISPEKLTMYGLGRPINLKNQSIDLMSRYFKPADFSEVAKDTHKGTISLLRAPEESVENSHIPVEPAHIVFVNYNASEECYVEPVDKCSALAEIVKNSFNFNLLSKSGFACARKLVEKTSAVYIEYNNFSACENALNNLIEEQYCDDAI
ncbi:HprK-related kinase A [Vibrio hannami]|uniref:HprK-related kinase A n=1 Tax=Vibrio hannami TaxID=2717094 RepID=UPI0024105966|nr:HprK-related kinase A [Vibrio hannami]MDG3088301.1 HprK-related kinase A [Vibrio hannami]